MFCYKKDDPTGPPHTIQNVEEDVNQDVTNIQDGKKDYAVRGIKGPFWFMFVKHFHITQRFSINDMHCLCAGVMQMLLTWWFSTEHKKEAYSVFDHKTKVNMGLNSNKPTI